MCNSPAVFQVELPKIHNNITKQAYMYFQVTTLRIAHNVKTLYQIHITMPRRRRALCDPPVCLSISRSHLGQLGMQRLGQATRAVADCGSV